MTSTGYVRNFNPRSREGSDDNYTETANQLGEFQSALPRGERLICRYIIWTRSDFNPRSREGSDPDDCKRSFGCCYFNPRSREGSDSISSTA